MKARKLTLLAALALMAAPALIRADDAAPAKDWSFTFGVKGWVDTWDTSLARYDIEGGNQVAIRSGNQISGIPFVSVGFRQWRFFGSYNLNTSYDFGHYDDVFDDGFGNSYYETITTKAKRKEWDINAGYAFNPHIMVTVGYKQVDKEMTSERTSPGFTFFENPTRRQKVSGPTIGLAVNGDITSSGRVKIYGAGAIGFMTQKTDRAASTDTVYCPSLPGNIYCAAAHFSENQSYENLESGFLFIPKIGLGWALTLGYRYQVITGNDRAQNVSTTAAAFSFKSTDITRGPTFGVSYSF
jgi:hypothetical protein